MLRHESQLVSGAKHPLAGGCTDKVWPIQAFEIVEILTPTCEATS